MKNLTIKQGLILWAAIVGLGWATNTAIVAASEPSTRTACVKGYSDHLGAQAYEDPTEHIGKAEIWCDRLKRNGLLNEYQQRIDAVVEAAKHEEEYNAERARKWQEAQEADAMSAYEAVCETATPDWLAANGYSCTTVNR